MISHLFSEYMATGSYHEMHPQQSAPVPLLARWPLGVAVPSDTLLRIPKRMIKNETPLTIASASSGCRGPDVDPCAGRGYWCPPIRVAHHSSFTPD